MVVEAGLEPGRTLRDLHQAILGEDPALDPAAATGTREHQGADDVNSVRPRMLPPALGDFTGQGAELAGIEAVLGEELASRPHWRLPDLVSRLADERHRLDALRRW